MRQSVAIWVVSSLAFFSNRGGAQALGPEEAAAAFHEAKQLSDSDGERTWGRPLYGPMIFLDPTSNEAIGNEPDAQGTLKRVGDVYAGKLPETIQVANTAIEWEGKRWTMVQWPLPQAKQAKERLLAHEMFHRIEPSLGIPVVDAPNEQLDSMEGRLWTLLEWRALAAALAAPSEELQKSAVGDALLFRRHRQGLFPGSFSRERALELNEGLAEYTGVLVSEPDAASARWHAISRLADPSSSQSLVRSFAYTSGPAYGLLLDQRSPGWRKKLTAQSDLPSLLSDNIETSKRPLAERALFYGAAALQAQEAEHKEKSDATKTKYRALLVTGPTLTLPILDKLDFSFDPGELIPLDEGMVYPTLHASDEWGSIEVTQGALVSFPQHLLRISAPVTGTEGTVTGPGWVLKLAPGWVLRSTANNSFLAQKK